MRICSILLVVFLVANVSAQVPTWNKDVAKIIFKKCASCHRAGGLGEGTGILLDNYLSAKSVSFGILNAITTKKMPPWPPDPNYRHFKGENVLTPYEVEQITAWVNGHTPEGNAADTPVLPNYNSGSQMNGIDKTIVTPEYTVRAVDIDEYRTFVVPSGVSGLGKFVSGIEYRPANNKIVHHIVVYLDATGAGRAKDALDSIPGFESTGAGQPVDNALFMGAWAPGFGLFQLPETMGLPVTAGSDYLIEMHYAPGSQDQSDSTTINIKYSTASVPRPVTFFPFLTHANSDVLLDYPLFIPANTVKTYKQKYDVPNAINFPFPTVDWSLLAVAPHMHKVGVSYKIYNVVGNDTIPLINIPRWRFNWQAAYTFQKPVRLKAFSQVWGEATYDNTTANHYNPNYPPIDVHAGEHTTDEMMLGILAVTPYLPGDEDLVMDSSIFEPNAIQTIKTKELKALYLTPNPTNNTISLKLQLSTAKSGLFNLELLNQLGQVTKKWNKQGYADGYYTNIFDIADQPSGVYYFRIITDDEIFIEKIVKN